MTPDVWNTENDGDCFFQWQECVYKGLVFGDDKEESDYSCYIVRYPLNCGINRKKVENRIAHSIPMIDFNKYHDEGGYRYYQSLMFEHMYFTSQLFERMFGDDT